MNENHKQRKNKDIELKPKWRFTIKRTPLCLKWSNKPGVVIRRVSNYKTKWKFSEGEIKI